MSDAKFENTRNKPSRMSETASTEASPKSFASEVQSKILDINTAPRYRMLETSSNAPKTKMECLPMGNIAKEKSMISKMYGDQRMKEIPSKLLETKDGSKDKPPGMSKTGATAKGSNPNENLSVMSKTLATPKGARPKELPQKLPISDSKSDRIKGKTRVMELITLLIDIIWTWLEQMGNSINGEIQQGYLSTIDKFFQGDLNKVRLSI